MHYGQLENSELALLGCMSINVAMYFTGIMEGVSKYIEW